MYEKLLFGGLTKSFDKQKRFVKGFKYLVAKKWVTSGFIWKVC